MNRPVMDESSARRALRRLGFSLRKSRQRLHVPNIDNAGHYRIVDAERNFIVAGEKFDMTLADVERWLQERTSK
jgi:hypothetical protein